MEPKPFRRRMSSVSLSRTHTNPTETTRILIAQLVLHLLPSPHFSLLIYILAFFSQVAMVHEENGVGMEDLARMFGGRIFGGGQQSRRRKLSSEIAMEDPHQPRMEGEIMMSWFLKRWSFISEGLFDVIEDAKMGLVSSFQDQQLADSRLRPVEKRCSVTIPLGDAIDNNGEIPNHSSGRDTPFRLPVIVDHDVVTRCESPATTTEVSPHPHPHDEETNSKYSKNNGSDELAVGLDSGELPFLLFSFEFDFLFILLFLLLFPADSRSLEESFIIPIATHCIDESSVYSATARKIFLFFLELTLIFFIKSMNVFWMYQYLLYLIKHFLLNHSTTTRVGRTLFNQRASQNPKTKPKPKPTKSINEY